MDIARQRKRAKWVKEMLGSPIRLGESDQGRSQSYGMSVFNRGTILRQRSYSNGLKTKCTKLKMLSPGTSNRGATWDLNSQRQRTSTHGQRTLTRSASWGPTPLWVLCPRNEVFWGPNWGPMWRRHSRSLGSPSGDKIPDQTFWVWGFYRTLWPKSGTPQPYLKSKIWDLDAQKL